MKEVIRWGVLGAAKIAVEKVIPSMSAAGNCEVLSIASRDPSKAESHARMLGIPRPFSSYEDLLADPDIDAVYIPLPNHLHLEWTVRSAEAGKHVLCEKPLGLSADEVYEMIRVRNQTGVKIQEAFMVRMHPIWIAVQDLIKDGRIGDLEVVTGFFSYFNTDPANIRNRPEMGGGGLLDIGCYCINISRLVFGRAPSQVVASIEHDASTGIDKTTSAILEFPNGRTTFTCATQIVPYQNMQFYGSSGRIEVKIPFNIPVSEPTEILLDSGKGLGGEAVETIRFEPANQFTRQAEEFSQSILDAADQQIPLEDSLENMAVIDAVFRSAASGDWERPLTGD